MGGARACVVCVSLCLLSIFKYSLSVLLIRGTMQISRYLLTWPNFLFLCLITSITCILFWVIDSFHRRKIMQIYICNIASSMCLYVHMNSWSQWLKKMVLDLFGPKFQYAVSFKTLVLRNKLRSISDVLI